MVATVVVDDAIRRAEPSRSTRRAEPRPSRRLRRVCSAGSRSIAVTVVWGRHLLDHGVRLGDRCGSARGSFGWRISDDALDSDRVRRDGAGRRLRGSLLGCRGRGSSCWRGARSRAVGSCAVAHRRQPCRSPRRSTRPHTCKPRRRSTTRTCSCRSSCNASTRTTRTRVAIRRGWSSCLWATAHIGLQGIGWSDRSRVRRRRRGRRGGAGRAARRCRTRLGPGSRCRSSCSPRRRSGGPRAMRSSRASPRGRSRVVILATGRDGRRSDALALVGGLSVRDHRVSCRTGSSCSHSFRSESRSRGVDCARSCSPRCGVGAGVRRVRAAGFSWFAGLAATRTQYWLGARERPTVQVLPVRRPRRVRARGRTRRGRRRSLGCAIGGSGCSSAARSPRSCSPISAGCRRRRSNGSGCRSCRGCCSRRRRSPRLAGRTQRSLLARAPGRERCSHRVGGTVPVVTEAPQRPRRRR